MLSFDHRPKAQGAWQITSDHLTIIENLLLEMGDKVLSTRFQSLLAQLRIDPNKWILGRNDAEKAALRDAKKKF